MPSPYFDQTYYGYGYGGTAGPYGYHAAAAATYSPMYNQNPYGGYGGYGGAYYGAYGDVYAGGEVGYDAVRRGALLLLPLRSLVVAATHIRSCSCSWLVGAGKNRHRRIGREGIRLTVPYTGEKLECLMGRGSSGSSAGGLPSAC